MIPRYSRPEMTQIWSDEMKFQIWLDIEVYACDAQAKLGVIPEEAAKEIREKSSFDIPEIHEIPESGASWEQSLEQVRCAPDLLQTLLQSLEKVWSAPNLLQTSPKLAPNSRRYEFTW